MRDAIRAVPDGTYRYGIDTDGFEAPYKFRLALTVAGALLLGGTSTPEALRYVPADAADRDAVGVVVAVDADGLGGRERPLQPRHRRVDQTREGDRHPLDRCR